MTFAPSLESRAGFRERIMQVRVPPELSGKISGAVKDMLLACGYECGNNKSMRDMGQVASLTFDHGTQDYRLRILLTAAQQMSGTSASQKAVDTVLSGIDKQFLQSSLTEKPLDNAPYGREMHAASLAELLDGFNRILAENGLNQKIQSSPHIS